MANTQKLGYYGVGALPSPKYVFQGFGATSYRYNAKDLQELIVKLGGASLSPPFTEANVDGLWGQASCNALNAIAQKYGYPKGCLQVEYALNRAVAIIQSGSIVPNLQLKLAEISTAQNTQCANAIKAAEGSDLGAAVTFINNKRTAYVSNPTDTNKTNLKNACDAYEEAKTAINQLISTLDGCGRTDLSSSMRNSVANLYAAVTLARSALAGPSPQAQACQSYTTSVDNIYNSLSAIDQQIRSKADAKDVTSKISFPGGSSANLSYLVSNWPNWRAQYLQLKSTIESSCADAVGYGQKMQAIVDTLDNAIRYAQAKLSETTQQPTQPAYTPPQEVYTPPEQATPYTPPEQATTSQEQATGLPGIVPLAIGGAALGFGALTMWMVMRRRKPLGGYGDCCY